jgi:hypothetical protein
VENNPFHRRWKVRRAKNKSRSGFLAFYRFDVFSDIGGGGRGGGNHHGRLFGDFIVLGFIVKKLVPRPII